MLMSCFENTDAAWPSPPRSEMPRWKPPDGTLLRDGARDQEHEDRFTSGAVSWRLCAAEQTAFSLCVCEAHRRTEPRVGGAASTQPAPPLRPDPRCSWS